LEHTEGSFEGAGGLDLFFQGWLPGDVVRAVLVVVHGLAEHGGRYRNLVEYLVPRGYAVYCHDLRGHGRSEGRRGYVRRFADYLDDLDTFLELVRSRHPEIPLFLVGHSLGGTIAAIMAARPAPGLNGLVLSGTVVQPGSDLSPLHIGLAWLLSRIAPKAGVTVLEAAGISRDESVVRAYVTDPLVHRGKISGRLGGEILAAMRRLRSEAESIRLPVLIVYGTEDRLAEPRGSRLLHDSVASADRTLKAYDGYYHEIFNDPGWEQVLADVRAWLEARLPA
jgi:alpha-beta hydrolase superfamily lysophospholipase